MFDKLCSVIDESESGRDQLLKDKISQQLETLLRRSATTLP